MREKETINDCHKTINNCQETINVCLSCELPDCIGFNKDLCPNYKQILLEERREKDRARWRRSYWKNHEKRLAYQREYRKKNKEKLREYGRENYYKNRQRYLKRGYEYRFQHRDELNRKQRERYQQEKGARCAEDTNT